MLYRFFRNRLRFRLHPKCFLTGGNWWVTIGSFYFRPAGIVVHENKTLSLSNSRDLESTP